MRILIIEDEKRLAGNVKKGLAESGYAVDISYDGEEGLFMATSEEYDLIILDISLPKLDGISLCKQLRKKNISIPVIMLTAKSRLDEKVYGLDSGADDYITKPFAFPELKSRIRALIRRNKQLPSNVLKVADLELDPTTHSVSRAGREINLTPKEFSILEYLMHHKDKVVTRTKIIEHVWDYNFETMSNVVDVFVANLRRKVDRNTDKKLIRTLHGVGYKISETE